MSDDITIEEALEEASSTLQSENEEAEETETSQPDQDSEEESEETDESAQPDGEEESEESETKEEAEESFLDKVPTLDELPPEMQAVYKNWQKQYTVRRQKDREVVSEKEARIQQLEEQLDQIKSQPSKAGFQPNRTKQEDNPETRGMTQEQLDRYLDVREQNRYLETQESQFNNLDSRFNRDDPNYDPILYNGIAGELANLRDEYESKNGTIIGFDFIGKAKDMLKSYDSKLKKQGGELVKKEVEQKRKKIAISKKENPNAKNLSGKTDKPMDLDTALDSAFKSMS